ncbi:uncharacterized protein EI90DRAFT_3044720 [Cantharellus anzutake]|uniref:uncharacterized protein n=1 Tax=Cantharellus anzutake TaxID=1750568 RepID=UPI001908F0E6|nr:uncharacterized protein EI90DRAFT_3044720 [Cantharellus anzutake]KAF8337054.1 hypothetical protein EI90DRAFT_3044720 [Cantharellus anzutake]
MSQTARKRREELHYYAAILKALEFDNSETKRSQNISETLLKPYKSWPLLPEISQQPPWALRDAIEDVVAQVIPIRARNRHLLMNVGGSLRRLGTLMMKRRPIAARVMKTPMTKAMKALKTDRKSESKTKVKKAMTPMKAFPESLHLLSTLSPLKCQMF